MKYYTDRYFPNKGFFLECGSGTSESSSKIGKLERNLIALDISQEPLKIAKKIKIIDSCVCGDIFNLPFSNESIEGIWNTGVMEHFKEEEIVEILYDFRRVLKDGSFCVLFWPWRFGPAHLGIEITERLLKFFLDEKIQIFPKEYTLFNKGKVQILLQKAGFRQFYFHLSIYGGFLHWVVVCKK